MSESHCSHSLSDCRQSDKRLCQLGWAIWKGKPTSGHCARGCESAKRTGRKRAQLVFSDSELAVVFAVDKNGNIQTYTTDEEKTTEKDFPLPAGEIEHMTTITTFQTSNPKTCWLMHGTLSCISW